MPNEATIRKQVVTWSVVIFASVCGLLWLTVFPFLLSHDLNLWKLSRSFEQLQHPPNTALISQGKDLGLLVGNGNHCDYLVGQLRSYTGTRQQIKLFYSDVKVWNPMNKSWQPVSLGFVHNGNVTTDSEFSSASSLLQDRFKPFLSQSQGKQKLYFVFFFDAGYGMGIDSRCS